jgi:hypothetical protein
VTTPPPPHAPRGPAARGASFNAGYRDDGAPGPRPQYRNDYYAAFLLDADGNNIEAVNHNR